MTGFDECEFEDEVEEWADAWTDVWAEFGDEFLDAGFLDAWSDDGWPAPVVVATWTSYERTWVAWERDNLDWWEQVGEYSDPPASWEPTFKAWEASVRPDLCVHCSLNRTAYNDGSCRTCYRWLARNRDRFESEALLHELAQRVGRRTR